MRIKCFFLLLLLSHCLTGDMLVAQTLQTLQQPAKDKSYFLYEVKLIDEFIERFNDAPESYIRQQCLALYGTDTMITRVRLLKTLLNKKKNWSTDTTKFISELTDPRQPQYLNFTDSNWYAEANCIFNYGSKKIELPVMLHIRTVNGGSKWMIAGIGNNELFKNVVPLPTANTNEVASGDFLPTSSHGTNFIVFTYVFTGKMIPADYFEQELLLTPGARSFISLIKQGRLKFQQVTNIRYHFFQVKNWVFTVDQFKRKEANTGWLISNLQKVNQKEKEDRLKKLLYP